MWNNDRRKLWMVVGFAWLTSPFVAYLLVDGFTDALLEVGTGMFDKNREQLEGLSIDHAKLLGAIWANNSVIALVMGLVMWEFVLIHIVLIYLFFRDMLTTANE